ncbi:MAG: NADH-quinone oxidoreductase subunit NuoK [Deltaproteobacteria bacterium]|nr:MAG: NADH-quinone oxidoreductase subunit NuoK [Deltaproteobacteria bacterium]
MIHWVLTVAAVLFALGIYGVSTRKNAVGILLSVELMANAVNLNLVGFGMRAGDSAHVFVLFAIALTVAEVVVGLALVVLLYRTRKNVLIDLASELRG